MLTSRRHRHRHPRCRPRSPRPSVLLSDRYRCRNARPMPVPGSTRCGTRCRRCRSPLVRHPPHCRPHPQSRHLRHHTRHHHRAFPRRRDCRAFVGRRRRPCRPQLSVQARSTFAMPSSECLLRLAATAAAAVAVSLDEGRPQCAVGCRRRWSGRSYRASSAGRQRSTQPDVVTIGLEPGLGVQGWQTHRPLRWC